MAAEIADVADGDGEIVAGLPLNVESLVHSVGKFVGAIVVGEGEKLRAHFRLPRHWGGRCWRGLPVGRRLQRRAPRILEFQPRTVGL